MPSEAVQALRALFDGYPLPLELRALHPTQRPRVGRFSVKGADDWSRVDGWLDRVDRGQPSGIYVVMNPLVPREDGGATTDADISHRTWLLVDVDSERPSGVSATNAEFKSALRGIKEIREWLIQLGWPEPFVVASGNGGHLMFRVDLSTSEEDTQLVQRVLEVLALKFDSSHIKVDQSVFNLSRIWRVPGTWARKGKDEADRPWRQAKLVRAGEGVVTRAQLEEVGGLADVEQSTGTVEIAKIQTWGHKHFGFGQPRPYSGHRGRGVRWVFKTCPWDPTHTDRSAYLIRFDTGQLTAGCLHRTCPGHKAGWAKLQQVAPEKLKGVESKSGGAGPSTGASPGLTDLGNAKRLVRMYGESLRYVPEWGQWLEFDGRRWLPDKTGAIIRRASAVAATIFAEAEAATDAERAKRLKRFAAQCESLSKLNSMEKLARSEEGVSVPVTCLDMDNWQFNCRNGVLDLRTGKLEKANRQRMVTKLSPVEYDPDATCPTWDRFLSEIFGDDQELVDFIHRALGYCLTGDVSEQVMFFCHGVGANGKTTFLRMMQYIMGDYGIQTDASLLMTAPGERHPTGLADLLKIRFAAASETDRGRHFSEALVKQITGDDIMVARKMRQDFFRFEPTHKLWLAANYKPIIKGNDVGIWRRLIYLPFEVTIPKPQRDRELLQKLRAESPGILARLVKGCTAWQHEGLTPPTRVLDKTTAYQEEMDLLREFFEECCRLGEGHRATRAQLYTTYRDWCEDRYDKPVKFSFFNRLVEERGFQLEEVSAPGGSRVKVWRGLSLGRGTPMGQVVEVEF